MVKRFSGPLLGEKVSGMFHLSKANIKKFPVAAKTSWSFTNVVTVSYGRSLQLFIRLWVTFQAMAKAIVTLNRWDTAKNKQTNYSAMPL